MDTSSHIFAGRKSLIVTMGEIKRLMSMRDSSNRMASPIGRGQSRMKPACAPMNSAQTPTVYAPIVTPIIGEWVGRLNRG